MSLIAAIMVVTLFTSLIIVLATQHWTNTNMNALVSNEKKAFYAAEAGIELAIRRSLDTDDWSWTASTPFAEGNISVNVSELGGDSVRIISTAQIGLAAKQNVLILNALNLPYYCVNISGGISGWFSTPDWDRVRTNVVTLPSMNLDSLKATAQSQGRYYSGNLNINSGITPWGFWSDPADHNKDANIIYVEGNLRFRVSNLLSYGIYVVIGDVRIDGPTFIGGIIYAADSSNQSLVRTSNWSILAQVTGGIIGNARINGGFLGTLRVESNNSYLNKFYNYCMDDPIMTNRLTWTASY